MADLNRLYDALKQADAAGNKEDAQQLADYIRSAQSAQADVAPAAQGKPEEASLASRLEASLKQGLGSFGEAAKGREIASLKEEGKLPEAATKMAELKAKAAEPQAPTLSPSDIQRIAHEKGYLPATMQVPSFMVEQILKSGPEMAESLLASYAAGIGTTAAVGMTPFAPAAPIAGAVVGALAGVGTYGYQQYGHFMERQALEKQAPEELDPASAKKWAAITAPVGFLADRLTAGTLKFGEKAVEQAVMNELAKRGVIETTKEIVKAGAKKGAVRAAQGFSEMPTEMFEQWAERKQAGLATDTPEAWDEYWNAGWSALAMGTGVGGALGTAEGAAQKYKELTSINNTVNEVNEAPQPKERASRETKIKDTWASIEAKGNELRALREKQEEAATKAEEEAAVAEEKAKPAEVKAEETAAKEAAVEEAPVAAEEEAPTKLSEAKLASMGISKRSNAFKELLGVDVATPEGLKFFEETLDNHTGKIDEHAVGDFVRQIAPLVQETENGGIESTTESTADRASVQPSGKRGRKGATQGAAEVVTGGVDTAGTDVGQPGGRNEGSAAALEKVNVGEEIQIGDKTYRKTDTGFELVGAPAPSEEAAVDVTPKAEEVLKEEEVIPVQEATPIEKQARALAKELRVLDPNHPLIQHLKDYDVDEATIELAQQAIDELKAQRGAKAPTTQGELRELSETPEDIDQQAESFADTVLGQTKGEAPEAEAHIKPESELRVQKEEELARYQQMVDALEQKINAVESGEEEYHPVQARALVKDLKERINYIFAAMDKTRQEFNDADLRGWILKNEGTDKAISSLVKDKIISRKEAELYEAISNGDIVSALDYIEKNSSNKWYRLLAKQLYTLRVFPNLYFASIHDAVGTFYAEHNSVQIDSGTYIQEADSNPISRLEETLLHEVVHAGTVNAISKALGFMNATAEDIEAFGVDAKEYLNSKEFKAAKSIIEIFDYLKETHPDVFNKNKHYGATNPLEMIAEVFADSAFQQELSTIPLPKEFQAMGGHTNVWKAFVNAIKNILGLNVPNNALQNLLEHGSNAVRTAPKEATPLESAARVLLYDKYKTEGNVVANKAKQKADDDLLRRTGTKPARPPKPPTAAERFKTSPVQSTMGIVRKFRSYWASFDQAINDKVLAAMRARGVAQDAIARAFHLLQVTQAVRADSMAESFLERGDINYDANLFKFLVTESKASMKAIRDRLNGLAKNNGIPVEKLYAYASAAFIARRSRGLKNANARLQRRVIQMVAQGKSAQAKKLYRKNYKLVNMTQTEINAGLEFFNRYPEFNDIFDTWNDVREKVLDFAMEQGLFDAETRDSLLEVMDYVPFFRVEQLEAHAGPKEYSQGLIDTMKAVRQMKGSHQEINDVFDNMERWIKFTVRKGIQNRAAQEKIKLYKQELPDDVKEIPKGKHSESGNTVSIWENGKLKKYEFQGFDGDTMVHGYSGMEPAVIPMLKTWNKVASFLRLNIILEPVFSIAQIPQDAFNAWFSSGVKLPIMIPLQVMKEITLTPFGLSQARKRLRQTVTVGKHDFSREYERIDLEATEEAKKHKTVDKLIKAILSPLTMLSMASDNVIRQAVYAQTMLETKDEALAIHRADEIINFRRHGYGQAVNIMRQAAPFVNANLQALHISVATLMGDGISPTTKKQAYARLINAGGQLVVLSVIYAIMMSHNDEYKKMDPSERDRNFIMPNGFKIPLRNDLFTLFFKILPEHLFNRYVDESEDSTKMRKALYDGLVKALAMPSAIPTLFHPAVEAALNVDTVTGRPIVGQGQEGLEPELQFSPKHTSQWARLIGEVGGVSPLQIDHLFQRYFATTAGIFNMLTNSMIADMRGEVLPTKSAREQALEFPFVSMFLDKENGARNMMDYYELQDYVNKAYKSYNKYKDFEYDKSQDFLNKDHNRDLVLMEKNMKNLSDALANLRKYETKLLLDKTHRWTADQKKEELDRIEKERQDMLGFEIELNNRKDRYIEQLRKEGGL